MAGNAPSILEWTFYFDRGSHVSYEAICYKTNTAGAWQRVGRNHKKTAHPAGCYRCLNTAIQWFDFTVGLKLN